jgi:nucleotide-binding universal stress UspA family protein/sporulation protein YlmC with PRC-barrel domain
MNAVKRILVPTDFSATSDVALNYGTELARVLNARLYLLHVTGDTGVNFEADFPIAGFNNTPWQRLETLAGEPEAQRIETEYALRVGTPDNQIVRYAETRDIDLIVMGTHGRSGVTHMVMGSVAEKIVRSAPCPVLTVREGQPTLTRISNVAADVAQASTVGSRSTRSGMLHKVGSIRGTDVHATDGYVGRVEEFYFDDRTWTVRYLAVNTNSWLKRRHPVLISPIAVGSDWGRAGFNLQLTREQVKNSPEIDLARAPSREEEAGVLRHFGHPLYWKTNGQDGSTPNLCATKDLIGAHIQARDGEIGHVDDVLIDEGSWRVDYLVVDTSNWIGGKWVLISPSSLNGIDFQSATLQVGLTREAVKNSPSIDSVTITPGEDGPPFIIM